MKMIFCQDPMTQHEPDSMFIDEVAAATRAGLEFALLDYNALVQGHNAARAVRDVPVHEPLETAVYRGWWLTVAQYTALYEALLSRGLRLINDAAQFEYTQYLPHSLPVIKPHTPRTIWIETDRHVSHDAIKQVLLPFAGRALILRDFVAAEKHYWQQACYIPSSSDESAVQATIEQFLRLRGRHFTGGLVFREFVEFHHLMETGADKMPLIEEYRVVYWNGVPIQTVRYWDVPGQVTRTIPLDRFAPLVPHIRSHFFTMDVARCPDDRWMILDLGDAQIMPLPESADEHRLYRALAGAR